jgi:hypothetical protein
MIAWCFIVSLFASTLPHAQATQSVFPSPRLAAVDYAIRNGFEIPQGNLVVANEVTFGGISDVPRAAFDRRTMLPLEETLRDAEAIARLLGADVKTGWAKDLVLCPERRCYASTTTSVFVIEELANGPGVYMKLYAPATGTGDRATLNHASVKTEQRGSGWFATGYEFAPKKLVVR